MNIQSIKNTKYLQFYEDSLVEDSLSISIRWILDNHKNYLYLGLPFILIGLDNLYFYNPSEVYKEIYNLLIVYLSFKKYRPRVLPYLYILILKYVDRYPLSPHSIPNIQIWEDCIRGLKNLIGLVNQSRCSLEDILDDALEGYLVTPNSKLRREIFDTWLDYCDTIDI